MIGERHTAAAVGALCVLIAAGATVQAQQRFDAVAREMLAPVPGLEVVVVHDRALGNCYTLFLFQPPSSAPDTARADATTVEAALAERDRQLDALSADHHRLATAQQTVTVSNPLRYQFEGQKVLADFEQLAREAILARVDARLAEIAAAPRLAVAGPSRCAPPPHVAEALRPAPRP